MARGKGSGSRPTGRRATVRVKTARGRTVSSQRWLQRQLNDPYVEEAKRRGYRSRAAFKLSEIDEKYHLLRPRMSVIDLGAAPGGWSQVAAQRIKVMTGKGTVIAVDVVEMEPIWGVTALKLDLTDPDAAERI